MTQSDQSNSGGPISVERLTNAYRRSLRRYLDAEEALAEAAEPVAVDLVLEHHEAMEHLSTIRGIFAASVKRSAALQAVEDEHVA